MKKKKLSKTKKESARLIARIAKDFGPALRRLAGK